MINGPVPVCCPRCPPVRILDLLPVALSEKVCTPAVGVAAPVAGVGAKVLYPPEQPNQRLSLRLAGFGLGARHRARRAPSGGLGGERARRVHLREWGSPDLGGLLAAAAREPAPAFVADLDHPVLLPPATWPPA